MFKEPFNFAFQRTPLQALGWYLAMLLFAALLGGIIGAILGAFGILHGTFQEMIAQTAPYGMIIPIVVAGMVGWTRPPTALNVLLALGGAAVGVLFGWLGGGILLAVLTTRPARTNA
jgi:hypothetical protein